MSSYMQKTAAANRLRKLAAASRVVRRYRTLQKYATGRNALIGAGAGGVGGAGLAFLLAKLLKSKHPALWTLGGAGSGALGGAGIGALLGNKQTGINAYLPPGMGFQGESTPSKKEQRKAKEQAEAIRRSILYNELNSTMGDTYLPHGVDIPATYREPGDPNYYPDGVPKEDWGNMPEDRYMELKANGALNL